jgi:UDP-N-acetyl-2-amino-2-deoxyglucuronate dehydrogenase
VRYALIGCGRIAKNHLAAAAANGLDIAALCDLQPERARAFCIPGAKIYSDHRALLRDARPQLVAIATDSGSHAALALDCIGAGCHVLIEKPVALRLSDADRIIRLAAAQKVVAAVCHQNRFNRAVTALFEAQRDGAFGRLYHGAAQIRWHRDAAYYAQADWRGRWESDGGALMNQCIHCIDLLLAVFGPAQEVCGYLANAAHPANEAEDVGVAIIRFANGALGILEGSTCVAPENLSETLSVFGERGTAVLGGRSLERADVWRLPGFAAPQPDAPPDIYGFGHTPLYADLIASIASGGAPVTSAVEGRIALELVLAVYRSAATGAPVRLPLEDFSSAEMKGLLFAPRSR